MTEWSEWLHELPLATVVILEAIAIKRGITRNDLIRRLLIELAGEPDIIENMLDMPRVTS